jgi:hypothetical protein
MKARYRRPFRLACRPGACSKKCRRRTSRSLPGTRATPPSWTGPGGVQVPDPAAELAKVTPDYLATLEQEQLDQIYARLTAGPIPDGAFDGRILLPRAAAASSACPRSSAALPVRRCT